MNLSPSERVPSERVLSKSVAVLAVESAGWYQISKCQAKIGECLAEKAAAPRVPCIQNGLDCIQSLESMLEYALVELKP
jgi:hypothetical protein